MTTKRKTRKQVCWMIWDGRWNRFWIFAGHGGYEFKRDCIAAIQNERKTGFYDRLVPVRVEIREVRR